jgi:hypothetical protein
MFAGLFGETGAKKNHDHARLWHFFGDIRGQHQVF